MIETSIEQQTLNWASKISREQPFRAQDLFNYLSYLFVIHEKQLAFGEEFEPEDYLLKLKVPHSHFFYDIHHMDADPDDKYDPYEQFYIYYKKERTLEDMEKEIKSGKRGILSGGCVIPTDYTIEHNIIKKHNDEPPENYSLWRFYKDAFLDSPMAGTKLLHEQGEMRLYDTLQVAKNFGIGLAKNLWTASNYTLKQKNAYNFEN